MEAAETLVFGVIGKLAVSSVHMDPYHFLIMLPEVLLNSLSKHSHLLLQDVMRNQHLQNPNTEVFMVIALVLHI